jgi:prevent-host-death family protein
MTLTDAKQQLSRVVNRVARGEARVVVHKSGLPVVAIISADEYRRFTARERQDRASRAALFETLARFSDAAGGREPGVIRAVLDANTIAFGAARFRHGTSPPAIVLRAWVRQSFERLISDHLLAEVTRTLAKPYFLAHVQPDVHAATLAALQ